MAFQSDYTFQQGVANLKFLKYISSQYFVLKMKVPVEKLENVSLAHLSNRKAKMQRLY